MGASAADSAGDCHDRHDRVAGDLRPETTGYAPGPPSACRVLPAVLPSSVDVFLPSAGEDLAVLANTFLHVSRLEWAGPITVYVLDDSAQESVRELAWQHGFFYLTRPNRGYLKKAGNLRFGYEHSTGDFIAIFDADFVPEPDYLLQLMPYTTEEDIAIVQSPQYFDTHPRMNWVQSAAGATQILFYRWVQPARDRSDAAICAGNMRDLPA